MAIVNRLRDVKTVFLSNQSSLKARSVMLLMVSYTVTSVIHHTTPKCRWSLISILWRSSENRSEYVSDCVVIDRHGF